MKKEGWFDDNSGDETYPVAQKTPNSYGLYDMHGNVSEWCWDWFEHYSSGSLSDPDGPLFGRNRILRGGSWIEDFEECRSASRDRESPEDRDDFHGFRLALDP